LPEGITWYYYYDFDDDDDDDYDDYDDYDDGHTVLVIISTVLFPVYETSEADQTSIPLRRRSKCFLYFST
jgi:hypothetical protein